LLKIKPHIISINETKINDFTAEYILEVDKYSTINKARNDTNGVESVALLVRKDIKFCECKLSDS
jgi:hypothetical protein